MAKNVTKKDPKSYEELKNLKGQDLLLKIRNHEIEVLPAEREDFMKFATMDNESRDKFISGLNSGAAGSSAAAPDASLKNDTSVAVKDHPAQKDVSQNPPSGQKPDAGSEYNYLVEITDLQENLKKQRIANSKLGNQVKAFTEQITGLQSELNELKKGKQDQSNVAMDMPKMPVMPDPNKFVEGQYDTGYKEEMGKYEAELQKFNDNLKTYVNSVKPSWALEMEKQLSTVEKQAHEAHEFTTRTNQKVVEEGVEKSWTDMWSDVTRLQEAVGLKTSVPIETINKNQLILNAKDAKNTDGTMFYQPNEILTAEKVIKSLPAGDYEKYSKVAKIVTNLYDFDTQKPIRKYEDIDSDLAWQVAIRKAGFSDLKSIKTVDLTPAERAQRLAEKQNNDNNNTAASMPGGQIGASEGPLNSDMSMSEKKNKLLQMTRDVRANGRLLQDKAFMDNYNKLRKDVGM